MLVFRSTERVFRRPAIASGLCFRVLVRAVAILPFLLLLLFSVGCEKKYVALPEMVDVHGTVLLDGQPVPGTKVVFVPDGNYIGSKWSLAYGVTNKEGDFQLKLRSGKKGAYSGWHRIYLSYLEEDGADAGVVDQSLDGELEVAESENELYPFFYNRESDLRFEVQKGRGILRPKFELSSVDPILLETSDEEQ